MMIRQILIFIIALHTPIVIYSQSLGNDTIVCGSSRVVVPIPYKSLRNSKVIDYEEGFFKYYPLEYDSVIVFHYGGLAANPVLELEPDNLIYNCKIGNIGQSRCFTHDNRYFRVDQYLMDGICVYYQNVTSQKVELANYILDNINVGRKQ